MVGRQLMQQEREELREATAAAASSEYLFTSLLCAAVLFSVGVMELA
jgi:hypothetical protein